MSKIERHTLYFLGLLLLFSTFFVGCSTERDSFVHRVYHNTTARYNGFFYAKESLREGKEKLIENHKDNYDEILPIYIYGSEEEASTIYPQMERVIEKSSLVVDEHTMKVSGRYKKKMERPEMNKWIDDNYLLIGIGHYYKREYYKAEEFFKFVRKKYESPEMQIKANIWLARTFIQRGQENKAREALVKASQERKFPTELKAEYNLAFAEYYIFTEEYGQAAKHVEIAIPFINKKRDKARPAFILAQLYQRMNDSGKAIAAYDKVLDYKPKYEMEFYSRINQAMAFSRRGDNSTQIKNTLNEMLEDDKNLEYRDQIHYALAEIFLEERNFERGIYHLKESLQKNEGNDKQRVKSLIRLADLYFEQREYQPAQAYYDSTRMMIGEEHQRYKDIANKAESLDELVQHLNVIERNDSLLQLASLSASDLEKRLQEIRQEDVRKKEEELERQRQEMLASSSLEDGAESDFWAYNPNMKQRGMQDFVEVWGDRPLEDNWRRKNKIKDAFAENEAEGGEEENLYVAPDAESMVKPLEEYMANVPSTQAEKDSLREAMAEAYYLAGLIYKEKLDDFDNAIESFEVLAKTFEESDFHVMTYYQLYRAYYNKEQEGYQNPFCSTCNSKYWGDLVLEEYPDSEYAMLVKNPDFLEIEELEKAEELEEYKAIFQQYRNRQYIDVVQATKKVIQEQEENHLLPKYYLLKALAQGELDAMSRIRDNYIAALEDVVRTFPETEEAIRAQEMLDELNGKNDEKEEAAQVELDMSEEEMEEGPFECNKNEEQWFALAFERDAENLPAVKAAISNFNQASFKSAGLRVTSNLLGGYAVVLVKQFPSSTEAMDYLAAFNNNDNEVKDLNSAGHKIFVVTKDNYIELFKNKNMDQYVSFFNACYGQEKP